MNLKISFKSIFLLMSLMTLLLAGCSSGSKEAGKSASSSGSDKNTLYIGATMPLSGPGASYGTMMLNGLKLGAKHVNEQGGVGGLKIEIISMDSKTDAQTALNASKKLIDIDKVPWITTAYTETAFAQQPISDEKHVILMNGGGNGPELAEITGNYYYNNVPLVSNESETLFKYLKDETDIRKLAILYNSDESMSLSMSKIVKEQWVKMGGEIVSSESNNADATNLKPQLMKIKEKNPDALLLLNDGTTTERAIKQASEISLNTQLLGFNMHLLPNVLKMPGSEGMITTSLAYNPDPEFLESFKKEYNSEPNFYSVNYYDQMLILKKAGEKALADSGEITGETLKKAIVEIKVFEGKNGKTAFGENGISQKDLNIVQIKNGETKIIHSYETK